MQTIWFETHATSLDNEAGLASGHYDNDLSDTGERQARELGERYAGTALRRVLCSDLRRSWRTAEIAFALSDVPIMRDPRLRECDYGEWERAPHARIVAERLRHIDTPFPGGQSYLQTTEAVRSCLADHGDVENLLIIAHRATWYALEHLLNGRELAHVIGEAWQWQPGWLYRR